jgi:methionyl-tRNA formyltransferase
MRIVFMGTPLAAVPTLERLLTDGNEVVAVWTQPDRPSGRGNKLSAPPVKEFALKHNLPVYQPTKIKTEEAAALFASHEADAAVVVAYGRILPPAFSLRREWVASTCISPCFRNIAARLLSTGRLSRASARRA